MTEVLFVGVTTAASLVHEAMPAWQSVIGESIGVRGVDIAIGADDRTYERFLDALVDDADAAGAVVTTHKVRMFKAAASRFIYLDPLARRCGEINAIRCTPEGLMGWARDPVSVGAVVDRIWPNDETDAVCLGAGGTGIAIAQHLLNKRTDVRLLCADTDQSALAHLIGVVGSRVETRSGDGAWDDLIAAVRAGSLVVNATGMGKDRPGSPVTDATVFPDHAVVWDLNYRGDLQFLRQAARQEETANLQIHDGFSLFCFGWAAALDAVLDLHDDGSLGHRLSDAASHLRPPNTTSPTI